MAAMKWSDLSRVETLLTQRKDIIREKARVEMGMFDCTIQGADRKDYLEAAELETLRTLLNTMLDRRVTDIDAKLLELGVEIDTEEPVVPVTP